MESPQPNESDVGVYDDWQWHTGGAFPAGRPPEQGYVHIGIFAAWLVRHDLVDGDRIAELGGVQAVAGVVDRSGEIASLREPTGGRLAADMLTTEGRAFTGAYYAPEYGYPRDWQRTFGRRADRYEVPGTWESYDLIEPTIDKRYAEWIASGRPELIPVPGFLVGLLARWLERRR
jgi:hypothetical protein